MPPPPSHVLRRFLSSSSWSSPGVRRTAAVTSNHLLSPVWTHLTEIQPNRASGIYLYDDDKQERYMDFTSGIGVTNTGHCHATVVQAIQQQAEQLLFGQVNIVVPRTTVELAHELQQALHHSSHWTGLDRFFFANSGAEAVEASVKLARHATGKTNLIVFQGSFHGRSHQAMAMTTAKAIYRVNYQPLPGGVFVAPFPTLSSSSNSSSWDNPSTRDELLDVAIDACLDTLETDLLKGQTRPDETAALVIEPVLGEGGYLPAPPRFLRELRRLCTDHDILLIADEVQSGMGRTGKLFALEHAAAAVADDDDDTAKGETSTTATQTMEPDILVMAKGLGSGLPISAIASRSDLMQHWIPGSHGGTYGGGSAIAAAAALASLQVVLHEGLLDNAQVRGQQLQAGLQALQLELNQGSSAAKHSRIIQDVRGLGLMVGTEFSSKALAQAVQRACLDRKLLLLTCGTKENVIRWIPPLIVTHDELKEALDRFAQAVRHVVATTEGRV